MYHFLAGLDCTVSNTIIGSADLLMILTTVSGVIGGNTLPTSNTEVFRFYLP